MGKIERLKVSNFQSLAAADIELGSFTVIVGPSNSGKSALLRALRAAVRNVNSPSAVRVGQSLFTAQIESEGTVVALERGKSQSTYKVITPYGEDVFTKAGRSVPEEVQKVIGLPEPEGPDMVFSTQIDPPFLLSETGSTAAKVLGDLTNVSRLHAAAKEANRRRLEASKVHQIRQQDATSCFQKMQDEFSDLHAHKAVLTEARSLLDSVQEKARTQERITELLNTLEMAESAEQQIREHLAGLPDVADIEEQAEAAGRLLGVRHALIDVLDTLLKLETEEERLYSESTEAQEGDEILGQQYYDLLKEHGTCPTCNQKVA